MINLLTWCIFGFIVGVIARFLVPGEDPFGCLGTIALGVAGSIVGGLLSSVLFGGPYAPAHWIGATIGAVIVLVVYRRFLARPRY
jgi:uncharacterized membrane protein YeaQ/YmgE (transglycosylase-associated protein family)